MKFGVFTDLHYDIIPDADIRVEEMIQDFQKENVEFVIELGDLCFPTEECQKVVERFKNEVFPFYFTIGNHNSDICFLADTCRYLNLPNNYYSFVYGKVKFVILDANYIQTSDGCIPYEMSNYNSVAGATPYVPEEQLNWLEHELQEDYYFIILSHQSLANDFPGRGIVNRQEVRSLLENYNEKKNNVLLCMNGHDHGDDVKQINGIRYYTLNSASYIWQGRKELFVYSEETHRKYPYLKNMILYQEPLHIIVTVDDDMNIEIKGMNGHYQNATPADAQIGNRWNGVSILPITSSLSVRKTNRQ